VEGTTVTVASVTELPAGTATFLFTDIEGSTRILQQLGDRFAMVLDQHHALIRDAITAHGGHEIHVHGDAFFAVFSRVMDAVLAALAAQRALAAQTWPDGVTVRVRMGLHTGEAALVAGDYVGLDVHRAARLCDAAHGGQVLLSETSRDVVARDLPDDVTLSDLGEHHLKDLAVAERIFQLVAPGLSRELPPLRSVDVTPHNLPVQLTGLVGREREVADLTTQLATTRLLTLIGTGGCGKTRLALAVGRASLASFADGVWLAELAAVSDPGLVPQTVAFVLGVREESGRSIEATLVDALRHK
jgi:class 3 adenylate cyclase